MMLVLKFTVFYATFICVSAATNTLELRGDTVYNQSFDLVCFTAVNESVPYAIFFRRNRSSQEFSQVAAVLYYPSLPSCNVTDSSYKIYTYSCSNVGKNITLTVPAENEDEHNTFWRCSNPGSDNEKNNNVIQVFINDPVRNVAIKNDTVVNLTEGISEIVVCETSPCRPSAAIYWRKNGNNITNPVTISSIRQSGTKNITTSSLQFTAVRGDNGSLLACAAYNGYGTGKLSSNVIIIVLYAPDGPPTISGYFNNSLFRVIENMSYNLVCNITGGNPLASLSWNCFGIAGSSITVAQTVTSTISLNVKRSRTGQHCQCISSQEIQGSRTVSLDVEVIFSPTVYTFTSPIKVIQGQPLVVVCSADGNPPPQLTWNPVGEDRVNSSRLYYSAISRDKAVNHTCTALNNMVPTTGSPQSGSDSNDLVIDVLYSPIVNPFISPVQVLQGQPLVVVCSADGNPSPQLTWNPAGEDSVNRSRLYYSAISRDKAINHTCTARNHMVSTTGIQQSGLDSKELVINVLYNASISSFTSKDNISVLNENSSLQLLCHVDSNPYAVISLYFENDLKFKMENAMNLSYTKTTACLDAGKYTCSARNSVMNGYSVSRNIRINVTCHPRLDHRKNISIEHYGPLGDNVTLEVYVIAYPEPTDITWYHREKETEMWQMFLYQSPSSSGLYSSIMIHIATQSDFGYYLVNMSNDFGIYSNTYRIIPESKPGVPTNFTVTVNGPDSVALEWTAGFWGGHLQYFIIQYRTLPDGAWVKLDRIKDSGSTKQTITITGLQQKTTYEFHLYAENIKGHSDNISAIVTTTEMESMHGTSFPVGAVAGGISGALVACVCVIFVAIFLKRRGQRNEREDDDFKELKKERPESGLVDNPVYDSSDPKPSSSDSIGAATTEYAVVVKKKAAQTENSSNVYAQVHKQIEKKKNGAAKGKRGKTSRGDVYENADLVGRNPSKENVYANSNNVKMESSGDNVYENPGAAASHGHMANKDGLLYADLMLDPPTTKNGKPVIRGMEDRTEYAEIAYGKRGEPLPDSIEAKEMNKNGTNNYTDE